MALAENEYGEDDDDDLSDIGFVNASQVKPSRIEKMDRTVRDKSDVRLLRKNIEHSLQYMKKKQAELASLGEWTHINCLRSLMSHNIHDDILRHLILPSAHEPEETGLSQPKSRIDSLLSAADIDNIAALDEDARTLSVRDVPGGTISFLFEKTSISMLDENDVEEDQSRSQLMGKFT